jgi:4a-hydroxytetrahydrobiopterin dehydratase
MRPSKLSAEEVAAHAKSVPDWTLVGDKIEREFRFVDFVKAMAFVNRVADAAEAMNHHPDIDIRYNRVSLALSTHDAGGLTIFDFDLVQKIDGLGGR